jgi:hypothetical protein
MGENGPELADVAPYTAITTTRPAARAGEPVAKPGATTSEFAEAQSAGALAHAATLLGLVAAFGSSLAGAFGADTKLGIIAGAIVAVAGVLSRTLVSLGYTKSRTDVKVASSEATRK